MTEIIKVADFFYWFITVCEEINRDRSRVNVGYYSYLKKPNAKKKTDSNDIRFNENDIIYNSLKKNKHLLVTFHVENEHVSVNFVLAFFQIRNKKLKFN